MSRPVPHDTRARQTLAADPALSAWVSANAGSGKTHVLTQRVVRLLLAGVRPARIICLTFTRAAAANMSDRVFKTLGGWTLLDDAALRTAIAATGAVAPRDLAPARALFAEALETPGGLKIQTIHAFCERVLHLFPFEANVPADFRVADELEQAELMARARNAALDDPACAEALQRLAEETDEKGFGAVAAQTRDAFADVADLSALEGALAAALGLAPDETETRVARDLIEGGLGWRAWPGLAAFFKTGGVNDAKIAATLDEAIRRAPDATCAPFYRAVFFTQKGEPRARLMSKALERSNPAMAAALEGEAARVALIDERLKSARALARTTAALTVARAMREAYARAKQARSLLDYDDLIARTRALLRGSGAAAWALYKLDGGVDHILVDEAQDTSLAQWEILQSLAEEFTSGANAVRGFRSFFAVGDEKQSIFSFQGAAPAAFASMRRCFETRVRAAGDRFEHVRLDLSFRSAPEILAAVDAVFAQPAARAGLGDPTDPPPRHAALKSDVRGLVEIWRPIAQKREPPAEEWALPLDQPRESDPPAELARRIARTIAGLIATGSRERVAGDAPGALRPIGPGDVMILVRRRDAFFDHMVRALKDARVPVAGADRLDVAGHIAVMDLVAAMRVALQPDDDLTLAALLKSPLFGFDDDDLLALAPHRTGSLWAALETAEPPSHRAAARRIAVWRERAGARPFDFLSAILTVEGGRRAMLARLGPEAADAIDELLALALAHERQDVPSLAGFAHKMEQLDLSVRRDLEAAGALVRVMTVHAAKGLESKIVFLPDTCRAPGGQPTPVVLTIDGPAGPALVWAPRKAEYSAPLAAARARAARAEAEEFHRLLYVAMTRAEERLYICGHCGADGPAEGSWYALIADALENGAREEPAPFDPAETCLVRGAPSRADIDGDEETRAVQTANDERASDETGWTAWMDHPAAPEREPAPPLRPSSALAAADAATRAATRSGGAREAVAPRGAAHGLIVHRLLHVLPDIAPAARAAAARMLAETVAPGAPHADAAIAEAFAALEAPALRLFFGPRSRAEAAIAARIPRAGRAPLDVVGRIDRLAETDTDVRLVDFKTGAPTARPQDVAQIALYRAAVARLYPDRPVRGFLFFTQTGQLQEMAPAALEAALAAL